MLQRSEYDEELSEEMIQELLELEKELSEYLVVEFIDKTIIITKLIGIFIKFTLFFTKYLFAPLSLGLLIKILIGKATAKIATAGSGIAGPAVANLINHVASKIDYSKLDKIALTEKNIIDMVRKLRKNISNIKEDDLKKIYTSEVVTKGVNDTIYNIFKDSGLNCLKDNFIFDEETVKDIRPILSKYNVTGIDETGKTNMTMELHRRWDIIKDVTNTVDTYINKIDGLIETNATAEDMVVNMKIMNYNYLQDTIGKYMKASEDRKNYPRKNGYMETVPLKKINVGDVAHNMRDTNSVVALVIGTRLSPTWDKGFIELITQELFEHEDLMDSLNMLNSEKENINLKTTTHIRDHLYNIDGIVDKEFKSYKSKMEGILKSIENKATIVNNAMGKYTDYDRDTINEIMEKVRQTVFLFKDILIDDMNAITFCKDKTIENSLVFMKANNESILYVNRILFNNMIEYLLTLDTLSEETKTELKKEKIV